jgi:hypothetical protein
MNNSIYDERGKMCKCDPASPDTLHIFRYDKMPLQASLHSILSYPESTEGTFASFIVYHGKYLEGSI